MQLLNESSASILIVDDEAINRLIIKQLLIKEGYSVQTACDGLKALQQVGNTVPDLILLDIMMPHMDGFEVTEHLKKDPKTSSVPIILLTALTDRDARIRGLKAGAEDFLTKPPDRDEFIIRVRNFLKLKKLNDFLSNNNQILKNYDPVTALPNRSLFHDHLVHNIIEAKQNEMQVGVILIRLDNFKELHEILGFGPGDQLIKKIAERILQTVGERKTVARLETHEFGIIFQRVRSLEVTALLAYTLTEAFSKPFLCANQQEVTVVISMGTARCPQDAIDADILLKQAAIALNEASAGERYAFRYYIRGMAEKQEHSLDLENRLRHALENSELEIHYQPLVSCGTSRLVGVEALLRWHDPENGMISPARFIPVAESTELILPIGSWVLHEVCARLAAWHNEGFPIWGAVNISPRQFLRPGLRHAAFRALHESDLNPAALKLEITESCAMDDITYSIGLLKDLKALGVSCALDDFGTGYSSLTSLRQLPLDVIKLDRMFVKNLPDDKKDRAIVHAIITLAAGLNLKTVAEGVEDLEQAQCLKELGCDFLQGFFFSKPLPEEKMTAFLKENWSKHPSDTSEGPHESA